MKRKVFGVVASVAAILFLGSCGGNSNSSTPVLTSKLVKRAFVTNEFSNVLQIVDAAADKLSTNKIQVSGGPQTIVVSGDKKTSLLFSAGGNVVNIIDNTGEAVTGILGLGEYVDSLAISSDGKLGYAAIRNASPSTGTSLGQVGVMDLVGNAISFVNLPLARRVVLSPNATKLLVFSDNSDSVSIMDTATKAVTVVPGFDRPVWGVFANDSTAYIMNCGPECGGTAAGVAQLDMTSNTITTTVPVSAATVGLIDGSSLYVAGTVATGAGGGRLDVLSTSGLTVSKSGVVIGDGYHTTMAISNGRLFVGSRACSNLTEGCLSIYNVGAGTAAIGTPKGEVTGMQAISGRNIVYVCEGGELRIYDSSTNTEKLPPPVDIVGKAWDVKSVD